MELGGLVVAAGVPEDGVCDLAACDASAAGGVELDDAEGAVAVVLQHVAGVVADGIDVVEVVLVVPLHLELGSVHRAGDDGVQGGGVRPEVVLDGGLAGLVLVLAAFLVAPPEVGGLGAAFLALDAAAEGIVEELDGRAVVHLDLVDAVVEVVVVLVAIGILGHVAAGVEGGAAGGDLVVGVVGAVLGLSGEGVAGPVAVGVVVPCLVRR